MLVTISRLEVGLSPPIWHVAAKCVKRGCERSERLDHDQRRSVYIHACKLSQKSGYRRLESVATWIRSAPIWFDADVIVHCDSKLLFTPEIPLGRLNTNVSE